MQPVPTEVPMCVPGPDSHCVRAICDDAGWGGPHCCVSARGSMAMVALPERVLRVGCPPRDCEVLGKTLRPPVQGVAEQIRDLAASLTACMEGTR